MSAQFEAVEPSPKTVESLPGPVLVEFGTPWCGYCLAAEPLVESAREHHPGVRHLRIEDARGRRLGRYYRVTLWPTLVFLRDGRELARLVRPDDVHAIRQALALIDAVDRP
jgi:thioredoxin 1